LIKYLGSKRRLVPVLGDILSSSGACTALDLFTGTTRVAQEFKRRGAKVTAVDTATYSSILAKCYIETDRGSINGDSLREAITMLNALPGNYGYFTDTFCVKARFFQPKNGERVDAIRECIEAEFRDSALYPILLVSLMEAADRVDSTTGVQMAYLKEWAPRAHNDLELRVPVLIPGTGVAVLGAAEHTVHRLPIHDIAYLDPPYNQHRYFTNYHIWETLVRWDEPEPYGVAMKRIDSRSADTKSRFNVKREMPQVLRHVIKHVPAHIVMLSYNNESWVSLDELRTMMADRGHVEMLAFDSRRYVGALIGIHNPKGERVGTVSHVRNLEYIVLSGEEGLVKELTKAVKGGPIAAQSSPTQQPTLFG
jgi:adenine-specific DNA-methyltransferase